MLSADGATEIAPVTAPDVVDPTGCGDAYRAGLAHGLERGLDIVKAAQIGSLMGALVVACQGTQALPIADDALRERVAALGA